MKITSHDRSKIDISDDKIFYHQARYVHHLSLSFRDRLTSLYTEYLCDHYIILDLIELFLKNLFTVFLLLSLLILINKL